MVYLVAVPPGTCAMASGLVGAHVFHWYEGLVSRDSEAGGRGRRRLAVTHTAGARRLSVVNSGDRVGGPARGHEAWRGNTERGPGLRLGDRAYGFQTWRGADVALT